MIFLNAPDATGALHSFVHPCRGHAWFSSASPRPPGPFLIHLPRRLSVPFRRSSRDPFAAIGGHGARSSSSVSSGPPSYFPAGHRAAPACFEFLVGAVHHVLDFSDPSQHWWSDLESLAFKGEHFPVPLHLHQHWGGVDLAIVVCTYPPLCFAALWASGPI